MHEKRPSEAEGLFSLIITLKKVQKEKILDSPSYKNRYT